jgi:hypothetical protein
VPPPAGAGGGVASWPGAVLGVVDAVSCGSGDRGRSDAELAVQGLVVSGGAVMFDADTAAGVTDDLFPAAADPRFHTETAVGAGIIGSGALPAVCFDEAFDKVVDIARLG